MNKIARENESLKFICNRVKERMEYLQGIDIFDEQMNSFIEMM